MLEKIKSLYKKYEETVNYLIVGVLTTIVSWAIYFGSVFTVLNPENAVQLQVANILSWAAGVLFAYGTNRKYVFKSNNPNKLKEFGMFALSRVGTLFLDMGVMYLLVTALGGNDKIAKLISAVLVTIANYVISKLLVFRKKKVS